MYYITIQRLTPEIVMLSICVFKLFIIVRLITNCFSSNNNIYYFSHYYTAVLVCIIKHIRMEKKFIIIRISHQNTQRVVRFFPVSYVDDKDAFVGGNAQETSPCDHSFIP